MLPRFAFIACVCIAGAGAVNAQNAQQIIEDSAKLYAGANSYSVEMDSRIVSLTFPPTPVGQTQSYQVSYTNYNRQKFKMRKPSDYFVATQIYGESHESVSISQGITATHAPWVFIAGIAAKTAKEGVVVDGNYVTTDIPVSQINSRIQSRMLIASLSDVVLRTFHPLRGIAAHLPLGLVEPKLMETETVGTPAYRISGKTIQGYPVTVWIEVATGLVVRSVIQRPQTSSRNSSSSASVGPRTMVVERLYKNQRLNPSLALVEFILPESSVPEPRVSGPELGFSPVDDLIKKIGAGPLKAEPSMNGSSEGHASDTDPARAVVNPKSVQPVALRNGQALSYEQMSGIVLIEGDGGTATGFMTKIRDVDFVVTNLHVLGGNRKMAIKTLGGEEIPMIGVFGAAGADIAIIRIGSGKGDLKLAADVLKTSKIGDNVVVVGNRQGGGVATQTSGRILGVGPTRIEVDAHFEPGNSGSPIVNLTSGEVIGVASYSETRRVDVEEEGGSSARTDKKSDAPKTEKRWFGYRVDSVTKWEAIDLAKWNAQEARIEAFREMSEALVAVLRLEFNKARRHPRLNSLISNFEAKMRSVGGTGLVAATEVKDLFRVIRSISEDGVNDLKNGDYYDYYRTSLYWETSIPAQLDYRKDIVEVLKKYEANSSAYLSRMRGGN